MPFEYPKLEKQAEVEKKEESEKFGKEKIPESQMTAREFFQELDKTEGKDYKRLPLLPKYDDRERAEIIKKLDAPPVLKKSLKEVSAGREFSHLSRLLQRSEIEKKFAKAYLENQDLMYLRQEGLTAKQGQERSDYSDVILGEGHHTLMFWTYAPYLFEILKENKVEDRESVSKIFGWVKDGADPQRKGDFGIFLKGLEDFHEGYALAKDKEHISHKFTVERAKEIVKKHLLIEEGK